MIPSRQPCISDPRQSSQSLIRYPVNPQFTGYRYSNSSPIQRGPVPRVPSSINYRSPYYDTQSIPFKHDQNVRSIQRYPSEPSIGQPPPYRTSQPVNLSYSSKFPPSNSSNGVLNSPIQSSTSILPEGIHRNGARYTSSQNHTVPLSNRPYKLPVPDFPVRFDRGSQVQRHGSDLRSSMPGGGPYVNGYPMPSRGIVVSQGFSGVPRYSTSAASGL